MWADPKTNWSSEWNGETYIGDYFLHTDYNRIKNNLLELKNTAESMYKISSFNLGDDKVEADTGGSFAVTVNFTSETVAEWTALITAYKALTGGNRMWFETVIPGEEKSFFVVAQPPEQIPQPEIGQNELLTIEMNLTIEEFKGLDSTVALTTGE